MRIERFIPDGPPTLLARCKLGPRRLFWAAWRRRLKAADVIDQAIIEYAEKYGYKVQAPRR